MQNANILTAVIQSGIKEEDYEYFDSQTFELHCNALNLDADYMKQKIFGELFAENVLKELDNVTR